MVRKLLKRAGVCLLSLSMVLAGNVGISGASTSSRKGAAVETKTGSIVIDGNDIKADNVNGLTYKGFGMLSANSTSDLLMDYKSQNPEGGICKINAVFIRRRVPDFYTCEIGNG